MRYFGRAVEDLQARLGELSFLLFTLTPHGPRRCEPVGNLSVNVVAVWRLITVLDGLSETIAASTLLELVRDR